MSKQPVMNKKMLGTLLEKSPLRKLRKEKLRITREALAELLNVSKVSIKNWEYGLFVPYPKTIDKLWDIVKSHVAYTKYDLEYTLKEYRDMVRAKFDI